MRMRACLVAYYMFIVYSKDEIFSSFLLSREQGQRNVSGCGRVEAEVNGRGQCSPESSPSGDRSFAELVVTSGSFGISDADRNGLLVGYSRGTGWMRSERIGSPMYVPTCRRLQGEDNMRLQTASEITEKEKGWENRTQSTTTLTVHNTIQHNTTTMTTMLALNQRGKCERRCFFPVLPFSFFSPPY